MSGGIDKLIVMSNTIEKVFLHLAREEGFARGGYGNVIDLRKSRHNLPIILHCDGRRNGMHKIEMVGVAHLGLRRTRKALKMILGDLSAARIYRIDLCTDILGISVWDLAKICSINRVQNYKIYRSRGSVSCYLQCSAHKRIVLYDKARQLKAQDNVSENFLAEDDELARIEVQFSGGDVPFKELRDLHRYAEIDLLPGMEFRRLIRLHSGAKPLHRLAFAGLEHSVKRYGLHATRKRFSSPEWAYVMRLFLPMIDDAPLIDIRRRLKRSVEDWLEDRFRFPRLHSTGK